MANEFVAKNGLISQNNTTVSGSLTTTGNATVVNAFIGTIPAFGSNYMAFSHTSRATTSDYSLLSDNAGITYLNAKSGQDLRFRIDNIDKAIIDSSGNLTIGKTTAANALLDINGNAIITGSLTATAGIIGSLQGTSSWASNAVTASYVTASNIDGIVLSASYAQTASYVVTALTASYVTASNIVGTVLSSSYALTASFALNSAGGTGGISQGKVVAIATGYSNLF